MGLRDIGASLPPGFRFYPSDEELVCHYLYKKICNEQVLKGTLVEIDLHTCEPWQLPDVAKLNASEWYFFSFRDRKYATGYRTNRATTSGYWKATGKDRTVINLATKEVVGMRKTLVFYRNRAPNGVKTGWIMHEFRLETPNMPPKEDWVLCRVFHKSKGPENSTEVQSPQHNSLMENVNYTSPCFPNSLNLASSSTPTNIDHSQTVPNIYYGYQYDQMTSFNSPASTHHDHDHSGSPNGGSNSLRPINDHDHDHDCDQKFGVNNRNMVIENNPDDFGFLWGTNFDENNGLGMHSNFVDSLRFDTNDNSMVLL